MSGLCRADVEPGAPAMVAIFGPLLGPHLDALALDLDPAGRRADLVVADHVRTDPEAVALALLVTILEERRHLRGEGDVVGDRLNVVLRQRVPHLVQRFDDLVGQRPDLGDHRVVAQFTVRPHRPLRSPARDRAPAVHHAAVVVAAEAEVDRHRAVLADERRPDLLGPAMLRARGRGEGVGDLVVEMLVERDQLADIAHLVADEITHRGGSP